MSKVEEIERVVQGLSADEMVAFSAWFEEYQADAWDRRIEADARSGKLDALADKALADVAAGRFREL